MSRRTLPPQDESAMFDVLSASPEDGTPSKGAVDGRHARSERSRQAMVDALLDLLKEGNVRPSSAQIADRAGVTQRTLFNQFGDMDSLVTAVAARQVQRFLELQPKAGDGPLAERVERYCAGLEELLEETMHVRWAMLINPNPTWTGSHMLRGAMDFSRRQINEAFARELDPLSDEQRDELLDALELEADPVVWRLRRLQQELSPKEARRVVARTMLALLQPHAAADDATRPSSPVEAPGEPATTGDAGEPAATADPADTGDTTDR